MLSFKKFMKHYLDIRISDGKHCGLNALENNRILGRTNCLFDKCHKSWRLPHFEIIRENRQIVVRRNKSRRRVGPLLSNGERLACSKLQDDPDNDISLRYRSMKLCESELIN